MLLTREQLRFGSLWALVIVSLCCIGVGLFLSWPMARPGFTASPLPDDETRMTVEAVDQNGGAMRAGLRTGDIVTRVDGWPIEHYMDQAGWFLAAHWPTPPDLNLNVERNGNALTIHVPLAPPDPLSQWQKLGLCAIALVMWFTGYRLFRVTQTTRGSSTVGAFWMTFGAVLGLFWFAFELAPSWMVVLTWLLVLVLLPGLAIVHRRFPARPLAGSQPSPLRQWDVGVLVIANIVAAGGLLAVGPSLANTTYLLIGLVPIACLVGLGASVIILSRAYIRYPISYIRGPIRLIAIACLINIAARLLFRYLPHALGWSTLGCNVQACSGWLDGFLILIPLAYLIGGVTWHLSRFYDVVERAFVSLVSLVVVTGLAVSVLSLTSTENAVGGLAILTVCGALLPQCNRLVRMVSPEQREQRQREANFDRLGFDLTSTLDRNQIAARLVEGISTAFRAEVACYLISPLDPQVFMLAASKRFDNAPAQLPLGHLVEYLQHSPLTVSGSSVAAALTKAPLTETETVIVQQSAAALWCRISHNSSVLGVLAIGLQHGFDPYNAVHENQIRRIAVLATSALVNCATYDEVVQVVSEKRNLIGRLHRSDAEAARDIWFEIHDDVINLELAGNIAQLEQLLPSIRDERVATIIRSVIESEKMVSEMLRDIGSFVYPSGDDDPLRFPASIRNVLRMHQQRWKGQVHFESAGAIRSLGPDVQHHALYILREALVNIRKHAEASRVDVRLEASEHADRYATLSIHDNGRGFVQRPRQPRHYGLLGMNERASQIGGLLKVESKDGMGTLVELSFPIPTNDDPRNDNGPTVLPSAPVSTRCTPVSDHAQPHVSDHVQPLAPDVATDKRPLSGRLTARSKGV